MESQILIANSIRYRKAGTGNLVMLILPGGGEPFESDFGLQDELARNQNLMVLMIDLLSFIKDSTKVMASVEWGRMLDGFINQVIGEGEFILLAHSLGTMAAVQHFLGYGDTKYRGIIFLNPGLANNRAQYLVMLTVFEMHRLTHLLPHGMEWMKNKTSFHTACALMDDYQTIPLLKPCLIILGRQDPLRNILTGWKRMQPARVLVKNWGHSSQKKNIPELVQVIEEFVSEVAPSS